MCFPLEIISLVTGLCIDSHTFNAVFKAFGPLEFLTLNGFHLVKSPPSQVNSTIELSFI